VPGRPPIIDMHALALPVDSQDHPNWQFQATTPPSGPRPTGEWSGYFL
jgi:hypothetical protein